MPRYRLSACLTCGVMGHRMNYVSEKAFDVPLNLTHKEDGGEIVELYDGPEVRLYVGTSDMIDGLVKELGAEGAREDILRTANNWKYMKDLVTVTEIKPQMLELE